MTRQDQLVLLPTREIETHESGRIYSTSNHEYRITMHKADRCPRKS